MEKRELGFLKLVGAASTRFVGRRKRRRRAAFLAPVPAGASNCGALALAGLVARSSYV